MSICASIIVFFFLYYYTLACKRTDYYTQSPDNYDEFLIEVQSSLSRLIWVTFTILAIVFFTVGVVKLRLLRIYFKDFFKQFGCSLWMANIALTLPLLFRAIFDAMRSDWPSWNNFWVTDPVDYYRLSGYNILLFFFGTYVPMLT